MAELMAASTTHGSRHHQKRPLHDDACCACQLPWRLPSESCCKATISSHGLLWAVTQ